MRHTDSVCRVAELFRYYSTDQKRKMDAMNTENKPLKEVIVYYKNIGPNKTNQVHAVNMAAGLTDEKIHAYFSQNRLFNIGVCGFDLMAQVDKIEIIK